MKWMLSSSIAALSLSLAAPAFAEAAVELPRPSPADKVSQTAGITDITVEFSSPAVKDRPIWGKLVPYGEVWRAGANAATTLKTDGNFKIGDVNVPAGTYTLFVDISDPDNWTLIVNKQTGEWGLAYDASHDLGKTKMTMSKPAALVENLTYTLTDDGGGKGTLTLAWENHSASVKIKAE